MNGIDKDLLGKLSGKELELLGMLAQGMNTSEISKRLMMSYKSVAEINRSIKRKLNVVTLDELKGMVGQ